MMWCLLGCALGALCALPGALFLRRARRGEAGLTMAGAAASAVVPALVLQLALVVLAVVCRDLVAETGVSAALAFLSVLLVAALAPRRDAR